MKSNIFKKANSSFLFMEKLYFSKNPELWGFFNLKGKLIGAEIGVRNGKNAIKILNFLNIEKLYLIDTWEEYVDGINKVTKEYQNKCYENVKKIFESDGRVKILKKYSIDASNEFEDNYFDFIYIDANHDFEHVYNDLNAWYPKLKKFGVMCGDDYGHPSGFGVIEAVNKFSFEKKVVINSSEDSQFWFVKT